jgi:hypothetical protein
MARRLIRTSVLLVLATGLAFSGLTSTAVAASTEPTRCEGPLPPGAYGDIVVPPNVLCSVSRSDVRGNIRAGAGSQLFMADNVIQGSIIAEEATTTRSRRDNIAGNFVVRGGGPAPFGPTAALCGSTVGGHVVVQGTTGGIGLRWGPIPGLDSPTVSPCGTNRISGNVLIEGNEITRLFLVLDNWIEGSAVVVNNRGPGTKAVTGNTVVGDLVCLRNDAPFDGSRNSARQAVGQCAAA